MLPMPLPELAVTAAAGLVPPSVQEAPPIAAYSAPPAPGAWQRSPLASGPVLSLAGDAVVLCTGQPRQVGRKCSPLQATEFSHTNHTHSTVILRLFY